MIPKLGDRVQLHPATDEWMQGDRYGLVVKASFYPGSEHVKVKLDKSGRVRRFHPDNILEVIER